MKHALLLPLLCLGTVHGKLPELDSIFYGTVYHNITDELVAGSETIVVEARLNGVVIAVSILPDFSGKYVLKVPIDDGIDPRLPGAARRGERVFVSVRNLSRDPVLEEESIESSSSSGFPLPLEKGRIVNQNLTLAGDLGGSMVAPAFKNWANDNGLGSGDIDEIAGEDTDGDGRSNMDEFLAGTDPNSALSYFSLMDVVRANQSSFLQFGPIIPDRTYTIFRSRDLTVANWTPVGTVSPGVQAAHFWFGDPSPGEASLFYRIGIEIEQP